MTSWQAGGASRSDSRPRRLYAFLRTYVRAVDRDRLLGLSAETAFFAVLSVFPALLVAVGLLGLLDVLVGAELAAEAQARVVAALSLVLTDEASQAVGAVEQLFEERRGGLLTFASLSALVTLSGAFAIVTNALNLVQGTGESRSWLRRRLLGVVQAIGSLLLLVLALAVFVVGPLLGRGEQLADLVGIGDAFAFAWNVLRLPVLAAAVLLWVTALLRYGPARRVAWRRAVPGAVLTGLLWLLATLGFRVYLAVVAGGNPVLGAFGGGAIVMIWVFLLSLGLLLGGELNDVLGERRHLREKERPDSPQLALFDSSTQPPAATSQSAP